MRKLLVLALLVACGSKKDDKCAKVIDKSMKVLSEISAMRGKGKLGELEKKSLVEQCQKQLKSGTPDPTVDCVIGAADDAAVRRCYMKGYEDYLARSKEIEAKLQLNKIGKAAKAAFVERSEFPKGKVGPTPAIACCQEQIKQCIPVEGMWADPTWVALGFTVDGAFNFQYTYESDGKTFTATATGDIGCTGKPTTTSLTGRIGQDGNPELSKL